MSSSRETREAVLGHELVEGWGGRVVLAPLVDNLSTTGIVEKVNGEQKRRSVNKRLCPLGLTTYSLFTHY